MVYDLAGIVCHQGESIGEGHYVAYVQAPGGRGWIELDDAKCELMPFVDVQRKAMTKAYICLYKEREEEMVPTTFQQSEGLKRTADDEVMEYINSSSERSRLPMPAVRTADPSRIWDRSRPYLLEGIKDGGTASLRSSLRPSDVQAMEEAGFLVRIAIREDGHCFFHALAAFLTGIGTVRVADHGPILMRDVRHRCAEYLESVPEDPTLPDATTMRFFATQAEAARDGWGSNFLGISVCAAMGIHVTHVNQPTSHETGELGQLFVAPHSDVVDAIAQAADVGAWEFGVILDLVCASHFELLVPADHPDVDTIREAAQAHHNEPYWEEDGSWEPSDWVRSDVHIWSLFVSQRQPRRSTRKRRPPPTFSAELDSGSTQGRPRKKARR